MKYNMLTAAAAMVALACASMAASANSITPYTVPGSVSTAPWSVNDHGVLVGADDEGGFIDDHGKVTIVNLPGSPGYVAGISNDGLAVGSDGTTSFFYQAGVLTPFTIEGEAQTLFRGISANGRYVAGVAYAANGSSEGFVLDTQSDRLSTIAPPAGREFTVVQGVNDSGVAVGSLNQSAGSLLFDSVSGVTTYFSVLDGLTNLRVRAINDEGDLGGWAFDTDGKEVGFVEAAGAGITTFALGSSTLIYGLNNAGLAVGSYQNDDGIDHGFVVNLSAVPEPSTTGLMALALLAAGVRLARRRALTSRLVR